MIDQTYLHKEFTEKLNRGWQEHCRKFIILYSTYHEYHSIKIIFDMAHYIPTHVGMLYCSDTSDQ